MAKAYVQLQGGWVGGVKKGQKHAYVIFEWSLTRANNYRKILCDFLANKPLGMVHWHPEISQKLVILSCETSKFWTHNGHFCTPNVLGPIPTISMHLILNKALL